ncbi:MAG: M23 family metallopeptidase [Herbiconiux sp.]|uniref:M23 family metallopeptidase n=1 Tax=Herbiconiux sp. TaxID=1871186 RepID=UPI00121766A7|nr:M23 family metallopeptidase [Herbiconiux sp.]TAJ46368.1 MAG: M23 family metallopeptidase [Herbiconiux sp.]
MPNFIFPCATHNISDDWAEHRARGSAGGVDFTCPYGSAVWAMAAGTVTIVDNTTAGSGGRYVRVTHEDGSSTEYLHLSQILVKKGQKVGQGETIAKSGASGFGEEYYYGAHLHVHGITAGGARYDCTIYIVGSTIAADNITPFQEDDMFSDQDRASLEEARRMLGVLTGYTDRTANDHEAAAGAGPKDANEARRMLGVILGWRPPATDNEVAALAKLYGGASIDTSTVRVTITSAVKEALANAQGASADEVAAAVDKILTDNFAAIPAAVIDEQADRLKG